MKKYRTATFILTALTGAALLLASLPSRADIIAAVQPGYQFSEGELPTVDTLNALARPTITISGTLGGTNVALAAGSVTGTMLSGTVVDGVTVDFNGSSPRAIEVMQEGIGTNQLKRSAFALPIAGGLDTQVHLLYDNSTLRTNDSGQLYVAFVSQGTSILTNLPGSSGTLLGAGTNGVNTNLTVVAPLTITNGTLTLQTFTTTNVNLTAQNGFQVVIPHGLGATPVFVRWVLVCVTGELGYATGDEVDVTSCKDSGTEGMHFTVGANATNVILATRVQDNIQVINFSTGASSTITLANWKLKCYARL